MTVFIVMKSSMASRVLTLGLVTVLQIMRAKHICYGQVQTYVQAGSNLDKGRRVGVGPTLGCMNQWFGKFNTVVQVGAAILGRPKPMELTAKYTVAICH